MSELTSANWSETAASNNAAPPNGWPEGMNPSDVNNSERENMSALKKWFNRTSVTLTAGGGTTAYTLTPTVALSAYALEVWSWVMPSTNAATATMNISGLGARNIQKCVGGTWTDVGAGDLPSGCYVAALYDTGSSKFRIIWNSVVAVQTSGDNTITSTDAGATAGPILTLDRNSASPAASDVLGEIAFKGRDNGAGTDTFARIDAVITDATAASEDGELRIATPVAGTLANRVNIGAGLYTTNASGGDKGADSINASTAYIGGTQIFAPTTQTASASSSIDFTSLSAGVYRVYFNNIRPATDGATFLMRVSVAAAFITTGTYNTQSEFGNNTTLAGSGTDTLANATSILIAGATDNAAGSNISGEATLIVGGATAGGTSIVGHVCYVNNGGSWTDLSFSGRNTTSSQVDGVRFLHDSGNITSGSITMQRIA